MLMFDTDQQSNNSYIMSCGVCKLWQWHLTWF